MERLRQNESRGNCPLVVAADTGLTSGEGVMPAMIGGRADNGQGKLHSTSAACAVVQPRYNRGSGIQRRQEMRYRRSGVDQETALSNNGSGD